MTEETKGEVAAGGVAAEDDVAGKDLFLGYEVVYESGCLDELGGVLAFWCKCVCENANCVFIACLLYKVGVQKADMSISASQDIAASVKPY